MQRFFDEATEQFRLQASQFVQANWPVQDAVITEHAREQWQQALVARGWSVPNWPVSAGGPGWNATQKYIWQKTCVDYGVELELLETPATAIVGPLILGYGNQAAASRFLPAICDLSARWCVGVAEPDTHMDAAYFTTKLTAQADHFRLSGAKIWVAQTSSSDWMCCLAKAEDNSEQSFLVALDLNQTGVTVEQQTSIDGSQQLAKVTMTDVLIPKSAVLSGPASTAQYTQFLTLSGYTSLTSSAVAQAQLRQLDVVLSDLAAEQELHNARHHAAIALDALQALELRYVDALQRGLEPPVPLDLLRIRSRDILLQIGALQVQCFGYYALPYPDEVLLHNEGPIGPQGAVSSMRNVLAQQVAALYEGSIEELKDNLARQLKIHEASE